MTQSDGVDYVPKTAPRFFRLPRGEGRDGAKKQTVYFYYHLISLRLHFIQAPHVLPLRNCENLFYSQQSFFGITNCFAMR